MRAAGGRICGALAVLAISLSATPARANAELEPGVRVDPGSPAAKQYVLQLNQARQTGTQGTHASSSGSPFGAGITPPGGGSTGGGAARTGAGETSAGRHGAAGRHGSGKPTSVKAPVPLPAGVLRAARTQGSSAGSGSWLALLGGGIAVLLLGGFGGTVLRHSRRPTPSS